MIFFRKITDLYAFPPVIHGYHCPIVESMTNPGSDSGTQITPADPSHIPAVIDLLVATFADDPGFLRWIPQPDPGNHLLRGLFELQMETQYACYGTIDMALNEVGDIVGVALWDAPDANHGAVDQARLASRMVRLFGRNTPVFMARSFASARMHPKFPHWYLYTIASTPESRGTGVGSALLNHGIARAGEEAIYLEATTTRSAKLYQRLGFVPLGYIPDNDDMPSELAMWKPPVMPR